MTILPILNHLIMTVYFYKTIYREVHGASMGSPVSGLFAEFPLRSLEHKIFGTFNVIPACWLRLELIELKLIGRPPHLAESVDYEMMTMFLS